MNTIHPLHQAILDAHKQKRKAVIPFLTAGFPTPETFWDILADLDKAGADIIEIGIPFSDPVADGPVIENASRNSLAHGVTLAWIIDGLKQRRGRFHSKIVLMGYVNPFLQYGPDKLAFDASMAGVSGFIIPDMPLEESGIFRKPFDAHNLALVTLVAPNTTEERMREYAAVSKGFVYVVSVLGITGGKANLTETVIETMRRARASFDIPLALGFGLQTPDQLEELPFEAQPNAAVLGSALLRHIEAGHPTGDFLAPWVKR